MWRGLTKKKRSSEANGEYAYVQLTNIIPLGCFPLWQTDRSETSGTNQEKMERHCSIESKFSTRPKGSIYVSTEISITS